MQCSHSFSKMFKVVLIITFLFNSCFNSLTAQVRTISGYVSHSITGDPLPGVNVIIEGTSLGTTTNEEGLYSLEVPPAYEQILFSFLGMRTAVEEINGRTVIDLQMEPDIIGLDEVVVTAMGQTREKRSLGYSVQELSGGEIETVREKNMLNSLQGRLAGVQISNASGSVSSGSRILIRGNSTLGENNQPLFVVDGIPVLNNYDNLDQGGGVDYGNTAMDLNPSDIENISVLKGANAAALYGSRALNGVVLITTKKGKLQAGQDKGVEVSFESNFMWDRLLILPEFQDSYGQGYNGQFAYVDGQYGGLWDGVDASWGPPLDYTVKAEDLQARRQAGVDQLVWDPPDRRADAGIAAVRQSL